MPFNIPILNEGKVIASGQKVKLTFGVNNELAWTLAPDFSEPKTFGIPFSDKKLIVHSTNKDRSNGIYEIVVELQG